MGTDDSRFVKGLQSAQKRLDSFAKNMATLGGGIGAVGTSIVAPLIGAAFQFEALGGKLDDMSQRTGMSVEALSELSHAAEMGDASFEDLGKAITKSQQLITGAIEGNQGNIDTLVQLGLSAEALGKLTPDQQLEVFANRLAGLSDPAERATRAMEIFGKGGRQLLPLLNGGAAGIQKWRAEARALGLQMTTEDATAAAELGDSWNRLTKSASMIVTRIGGAVAPALQFVMDLITPLAAATSKWIDQNRGLVVTVLAVGVTLMGVGAALITVAGLAAGLSIAIGGAMTAGTMLMTALGGIGAALGLLASPIGIVSTLLVAGAAYWLMYTESGQATVAWFASNFTALQDIAGETMTGVFNAIKGGDLGLAAEIAFTGVKLAAATIMESVLALFGTSIDGMLKMFNDFVKQIVNYTQGLITATKASFNVLTGGQFSEELDQLGAVANTLTNLGELGLTTTLDGLGDALDVDGLKAKLEELNRTAAAAAEANSSGQSSTDFQKLIDGLSAGISSGMQNASGLSSIGTFSGQQIAMMGFASEDYQLRTAIATERMNRQMDELNRKQQVVT
jgi:hypothetical protein